MAGGFVVALVVPGPAPPAFHLIFPQTGNKNLIDIKKPN
jgi:hypothetical protein